MSIDIEQDSRREFVLAMSHTASAVNVVTTDGPAGRFGTTISAMAPVSADTEKPSLLICINWASTTAKPILRNRQFCVNVLSDRQQSIADCFAGRHGSVDPDFKFACADWVQQPQGSPCLVGAVSCFDCRLLDEKLVGTHHVIFGQVEEIISNPGKKALLYSRRRYGCFHDL